MGPLDIPEVLIGLSLIAVVAWAIYNYTHRNVIH
jgi:hypothetical protein